MLDSMINLLYNDIYNAACKSSTNLLMEVLFPQNWPGHVRLSHNLAQIIGFRDCYCQQGTVFETWSANPGYNKYGPCSQVHSP